MKKREIQTNILACGVSSDQTGRLRKEFACTSFTTTTTPTVVVGAVLIGYDVNPVCFYCCCCCCCDELGMPCESYLLLRIQLVFASPPIRPSTSSATQEQNQCTLLQIQINRHDWVGEQTTMIVSHLLLAAHSRMVLHPLVETPQPPLLRTTLSVATFSRHTCCS